MPIFAALIGSAFTGLATLLAGFLSQKVAIGLAAATTLGGLIGALLLLLTTTVNPLLGQLFSTGYGQLFGFFIPPVAPACLTAFSTVWVACTLYTWQKKSLDLFVQA